MAGPVDHLETPRTPAEQTPGTDLNVDRLELFDLRNVPSKQNSHRLTQQVPDSLAPERIDLRSLKELPKYDIERDKSMTFGPSKSQERKFQDPKFSLGNGIDVKVGVIEFRLGKTWKF